LVDSLLTFTTILDSYVNMLKAGKLVVRPGGLEASLPFSRGCADDRAEDRLLRLSRGAEGQQLVPAVNVVVVDDAGELLLIRRTDNGNWAVPGGAVDLGESVAQAAVRETLEESGIECAITGIVGIYSDPKHVILYTSNGEARQEFSIVLTARPLTGQPTPGSESSQVRWVPKAELPAYTMHRSMRIRINDFLARNESPVITRSRAWRPARSPRVAGLGVHGMQKVRGSNPLSSTQGHRPVSNTEAGLFCTRTAAKYSSNGTGCQGTRPRALPVELIDRRPG
jgi:ADP-ribose pyrophosphatase YjhB (NUDIX family)